MTSETVEDPVQEDSPERPALTPDGLSSRGLTIPENRLAGSASCLNCGTPLQGPFCYYCGQPDRNFMRFFPVLLRELMEDFLDLDSRFMRTLKPLLFRPGKLTRDYLDGRRFRYTPPLRLYLFSSIACFFLVAVLASDAIEIHSDEEDSEQVAASIIAGRVDDADLQAALEKLEPERKQEVEQALQKVTDASYGEGGGEGEGDSQHEHGDTININGKPWNRETNPFVVNWLPEWVNDWINDEIEASPAKGREIEKNPDLITEKVFDVLPATMFVLLPIVALLFKFWYLFAKKYYIEHLIFALHNHSFLFVMILLSIALTALASWAEPAGEGRITTAVTWSNVAIWAWVPLYLLISLKRVYAQGWGMTLAKYCLIGISYVVLVVLTAGFVALLSFVLL